MNSLRLAVFGSTFGLAMILAAPLLAQDSPARKELRRADLSGAPGMEVVLSISEFRPGDTVPVHFHNGIEAAYVLEGGTVENPGNAPRAMTTGTPIMNLRDAPHGGWTVVGDKTIKLLTVHVVDKGKPLYDTPKK